jgi:hypothetical protein
MMLLTPAHEEQSSGPIMNISVALNCFNPACFITTVRSGPSPESGAFIGEFECVYPKAKTGHSKEKKKLYHF